MGPSKQRVDCYAECEARYRRSADIGRLIMLKWQHAALVALITIVLVVAAWGLLTEDFVEPWQGYRWNKSTRQVEWLSNSSSLTRRDCVEKTKLSLRGQPGYSEPIGCLFRGNNYWRVWLTELFVEDTHVRCIGKSKNGDTPRYRAQISARENDVLPCLGPIEALFGSNKRQ